MQLTKEVLEQVLDKKLGENTKIIIKRIDEAQEELARMTKDGFDDVLDRLDVRERMQKLENEMAKIKVALHLS